MRLIKMLGLAAAAAVAAMALVGASSASAANTLLCNTHTALTCSEANKATSVSMDSEGVGVLLNSSPFPVLCLNYGGAGQVLGLTNPQSVHITELTFTVCGTTSAHSNCTVTILQFPLANLNKTGLDTGVLTATSGELLLNCDNVVFGVDIHCVYDATGLQFSVGGQMLTASNTKVDIISGEACPEESFLDGLLNTTSNRYVLA